MKLVTTEEMRAAEQAAVDKGETWEGLMDRAGKAVADNILSYLGESDRQPVLALIGPGNNGGDALVASWYLLDAGLSVTIYLWNRKEENDPLLQRLVEKQVPVLRAAEDKSLAALRRALNKAAVVVDGLLGVGLERPIEGQLRDIVEKANSISCPLVVAVDIPTGVQADTGQVLGAAIRADLTVTMSHPKRGLYQFPGAGCAGAVVVAPIGIPDELLSGVQVEVLDAESVRALLPDRPPDSHKGTFGRVLVICGSLYYTGAPYMAGMGAYRVGAGLVTLAPPRTIYPSLAAHAIETTFLPLPEGEVGSIGEDAVRVVAEALPKCQSLIVGCGLGQDEGTVAFVRRLLNTREHERSLPGIGFLPRTEATEVTWTLPPLVIDADGLNALDEEVEWWKSLPPGRAVLTPHPGEMGRLLGTSAKEVQSSRIDVARRAAANWQQIVVLKGADTVIAHPDGRVMVNPTATPALATAGTGDVLAGAIGGFLAQGLGPFEAAMVGVYVHGMAGTMLQEQVGLAGSVAGDLLDLLPDALEDLREGL